MIATYLFVVGIMSFIIGYELGYNKGFNDGSRLNRRR